MPQLGNYMFAQPVPMTMNTYNLSNSVPSSPSQILPPGIMVTTAAAAASAQKVVSNHHIK